MGSGDKILNRIKYDCDAKISEIDAEAERRCSEIAADAQLEADKISAEIAAKAQSRVVQMKAASKSRCELETRNALLKRRREEIDKTYSAILDTMQSLPDKEYFELIYKLASKLSGMNGEVMLGKKDLQRLPKDFLQQLENCGIKASVCNTPCDIESGFILKCGDIEENMDFSAVLAEKRDVIEDFINQELFKA